jgi:uncharacterized protein YcbK (DUF882 family)
MAKLTENFSLHEFQCKDGSDIPNEYLPNAIQLAKNLQVLRDYINKPITINSAYRSPEYNASAKVKGAKNSQHLLAKAADLRVKGMTPRELANVIESHIRAGKIQQGGVGVYPTFVHYDIRGTKARW